MVGISFELALIVGILIAGMMSICEHLESIEQLLKELKRMKRLDELRRRKLDGNSKRSHTRAN